MSNSSKLFSSFFNRNPQDPGTEGWLAELVEQHPYFATAQFYRLSGTAKNHPDYQPTLNRTGLFFNHPYWLNYQMNRHQISFSRPEEPAIHLPEELTSEIRVSEAGQLIVPELPSVEQEMSFLHEPEEAPTVNTEPPPVEFSPATSAEELSELPDPVALESTATPEMEHHRDLNQLEEKEEQVPTVSEEVAQEVEAAGQIALSSEFLHIASSDIEKSEATSSETELPLFEPLHTTDYFASQGIKASDVIKPDDKLGQQMRRFTDWLKTMKRIPEPDGENPPAPLDVVVETLAERSNQAEEVVTEAMADILIMQGQHKKATDILYKLSLLNPDKSSYFASRIEELNK